MKQILNFFKEKPITKIIREAISFEEFKEMMTELKPKELFSQGFSDTQPLFVITEYKPDGKVMFFCSLWASKTPAEVSLNGLYTALERSQGIEGMFILRDAPEEKELVAEEKK